MKIENQILKIEWSQPSTANAVTHELLSEIKNAVDYINANQTKIFWIHFNCHTDSKKHTAISGGDLSYLFKTRLDQKKWIEYFKDVYDLCLILSSLSIPIIFTASGDVIGGGIELFTCADLRYTTQQTRFIFKQLDNGLFTAFGGCKRLIDLVGLSLTQSWIWEAATIDSLLALQSGLIQQIYQDNETLLLHAQNTITKLARYDLEQIKTQKQLFKTKYHTDPLQEWELIEAKLNSKAFIEFLEKFNQSKK